LSRQCQANGETASTSPDWQDTAELRRFHPDMRAIRAWLALPTTTFVIGLPAVHASRAHAAKGLAQAFFKNEIFFLRSACAESTQMRRPNRN